MSVVESIRIVQMSLHYYCQPADGVLDPNSISDIWISSVSVLALTRQLLTDTSLPYNIIIVDMIASHTRVDRKPLHSLRNSSANGVGTAANSIDCQRHAQGQEGMQNNHTHAAQCIRYCVCACTYSAAGPPSSHEN